MNRSFWLGLSRRERERESVARVQWHIEIVAIVRDHNYNYKNNWKYGIRFLTRLLEVQFELP